MSRLTNSKDTRQALPSGLSKDYCPSSTVIKDRIVEDRVIRDEDEASSDEEDQIEQVYRFLILVISYSFALLLV